jgi:hypothetical protein
LPACATRVTAQRRSASSENAKLSPQPNKIETQGLTASVPLRKRGRLAQMHGRPPF